MVVPHGFRRMIIAVRPVALLLCLLMAFDIFVVPSAGLQTVSAASERRRSEKKPKLDVGYQPTPYEVVEEMLKMANVRKDDIVYDLGCGDGRIVIMAAKERKASGVGIDLDPERIRESNANAQKAGVTDRVSFHQQDLFKTDIHSATVVMLYLWPEVNLRLRPKLFTDLKPGTRVLSHNHAMGDWNPDQTVKVQKHTIYYWVIPANIAGTWTWPLKMNNKTFHASLRLSQKFQEIKGTLTVGNTATPIRDAKLEGHQLSLSAPLEIEGKKVVIKLNGRIETETALGTIKISGGGAPETAPWEAKRDAGK